MMRGFNDALGLYQRQGATRLETRGVVGRSVPTWRGAIGQTLVQ